MPDAIAIEIANAVVGALNAATLSQSFTAARHYVPKFKLKDTDALTVAVVPRSVSGVVFDRARDSEDYVIDIGIMKRVPGLVQADIDALMYLVQQIGDLFGRKKLTGYESARCVAGDNNPIYAPDHLLELSQFTSVQSLTFRVWR